MITNCVKGKPCGKSCVPLNTLCKRYLVIGGYIDSKNDGQRLWVSPYKLLELYNVNPAECLIADENGQVRGYSEKQLAYLIRLTPKQNGDYTLC